MISISCRPRWQPTDYLLEELRRYSAGVDTDLEDIDLSDQELAGIDLTGATLVGASLNGADMRGAILERVCLWQVDARFVDLSGASMRHALIIATDLKHANLNNIVSDGSVLMPSDDRSLRRVDSYGRFQMVEGLVRCSRRPTTRSTPWA